MIYEPSDLTIAVISRFWTCSTDPDVDVRFNTLALNNLLVPVGGLGRHSGPLPHVAQYLRNNPPPHAPLLLQRVLHGAHIPYSATNFLTSLALHFNLPGFDAEHADLSMCLLISLYHSVFTESYVDELMYTALDRQQGKKLARGPGEVQHTEFLRALRIDAEPLWTTLFTSAVKYLDKPDDLPEAIVVFAVRVMDFVATALLHSFMSSPAELFDLVMTLVRAGLFQTLEDTIAVMFTIDNMHGAYIIRLPLSCVALKMVRRKVTLDFPIHQCSMYWKGGIGDQTPCPCTTASPAYSSRNLHPMARSL